MLCHLLLLFFRPRKPTPSLPVFTGACHSDYGSFNWVWRRKRFGPASRQQQQQQQNGDGCLRVAFYTDFEIGNLIWFDLIIIIIMIFYMVKLMAGDHALILFLMYFLCPFFFWGGFLFSLPFSSLAVPTIYATIPVWQDMGNDANITRQQKQKKTKKTQTDTHKTNPFSVVLFIWIHFLSLSLSFYLSSFVFFLLLSCYNKALADCPTSLLCVLCCVCAGVRPLRLFFFCLYSSHIQ